MLDLKHMYSVLYNPMQAWDTRRMQSQVMASRRTPTCVAVWQAASGPLAAGPIVAVAQDPWAIHRLALAFGPPGSGAGVGAVGAPLAGGCVAVLDLVDGQVR